MISNAEVLLNAAPRPHRGPGTVMMIMIGKGIIASGHFRVPCTGLLCVIIYLTLDCGTKLEAGYSFSSVGEGGLK